MTLHVSFSAFISSVGNITYVSSVSCHQHDGGIKSRTVRLKSVLQLVYSLSLNLQSLSMNVC